MIILFICIVVYLCRNKEISKLGKWLIGIACYIVGSILSVIDPALEQFWNTIPYGVVDYLGLLWILSIPSFFVVLIVYLVQRHKNKLSKQLQEKEVDNQNLKLENAALRRRMDKQIELQSKMVNTHRGLTDEELDNDNKDDSNSTNDEWEDFI